MFTAGPDLSFDSTHFFQTQTEVKIIDEHGNDEETGLISPIRPATLLTSKSESKVFNRKIIVTKEDEPHNQYPEEIKIHEQQPQGKLPKVS